ncbi:MAG: hypothetical protein HY716_09880 [Planctomycetes bacterium]|nr:hypothetical protein [Planctomycetota bacterium]
MWKMSGLITHPARPPSAFSIGMLDASFGPIFGTAFLALEDDERRKLGDFAATFHCATRLRMPHFPSVLRTVAHHTHLYAAIALFNLVFAFFAFALIHLILCLKLEFRH